VQFLVPIEPDVIIERYSLHSDPTAVLVSPMLTPHRCHNNLVSDSSPDTSTSMAAESWMPSVPNDPTALAEIVDTLSNILSQLTTIYKRLKLRGEATARPD
jgi:hypothetical protein